MTLTVGTTVSFDPIERALEAIRDGASVVVVDDENRENEGDLICAAQFATPKQINFMATEARGLICLAMEGSRLDELDLPLMVDQNTDSNQTAFTVSIDAGPEAGVSTGISAEDRARTIQVALHPQSRPSDLRRPGQPRAALHRRNPPAGSRSGAARRPAADHRPHGEPVGVDRGRPSDDAAGPAQDARAARDVGGRAGVRVGVWPLLFFLPPPRHLTDHNHLGPPTGPSPSTATECWWAT